MQHEYSRNRADCGTSVFSFRSRVGSRAAKTCGPAKYLCEDAKDEHAAIQGRAVSIDFEGGYAEAPAELARNVSRLLEVGVVGINFEDRIVAGTGLYEVAAQSGRIAAIRAAADDADISLFINARTDVFLQAPANEQAGLLDEALTRARAYADAGANGFFVPGLCDQRAIGTCSGMSPPGYSRSDLSALPRALSAGYLSAFTLILRCAAATRSTPSRSASLMR